MQGAALRASSSEVVSAVLRLTFDNRMLRTLPVDRTTGNDMMRSRTVRQACLSIAKPTPLLRPTVVAVSPSALGLVGIHVDAAHPGALPTELSSALCNVLSGNVAVEGSEPYAHCYAGHQFGGFAGQLGDGAAIALGEVSYGGATLELQLKGAGPTPYSRQSDGRKVLRSSIREFLCSEYMHHLGIPTTRAAALVTSDSTVERDPFYNGQLVSERCTVCTRIAPSFLRFGSLEICRDPEHDGERPGPSAGEPEIVKRLFVFAATTYFGDTVDEVRRGHLGDRGDLAEATVVAVFRVVVERTAALAAHWQSVGFCHGVLNTDNMSILGLTIDYGPFAFLAHYDNTFVSNLSDASGRYAFGQQASVCGWNLKRFAEGLSCAYPDVEDVLLRIVDESYAKTFTAFLEQVTSKKLGMEGASAQEVAITTRQFYEVLDASKANLHNVLWTLQSSLPFVGSYYDLDATDRKKRLTAKAQETAALIASLCCATPVAVATQLRKNLRRFAPQIPKQQIEPLRELLKSDASAARHVFQNAPAFKVEAFLVEQEDRWRKYEAAVNLAEVFQMMTVQEKRARDEALWRAFLEAYYSALETVCPTQDAALKLRASMMRSTPQFVLYPWILDDAIQKATLGDYTLVQALADRVAKPYEADARDGVLWSHDPPEDPLQYLCSCSS